MKKYFILLHVTLTFLLACGGDCIQCHKVLEPIINDKDHQILNSCTTCHNKPAKHGNSCGQDCFECHPREKLYSDQNISEHQAIKACSACHQEKVDFLKPKPKSPNKKTLIGFIQSKE